MSETTLCIRVYLTDLNLRLEATTNTAFIRIGKASHNIYCCVWYARIITTLAKNYASELTVIMDSTPPDYLGSSWHCGVEINFRQSRSYDRPLRFVSYYICQRSDVSPVLCPDAASLCSIWVISRLVTDTSKAYGVLIRPLVYSEASHCESTRPRIGSAQNAAVKIL